MRRFLLPSITIVLIIAATGLALAHGPDPHWADYPCSADFDRSGRVDLPDVATFATYYYSNDQRANFNGVNGVNLVDVMLLAMAYGTDTSVSTGLGCH